MGLSTYVKLDVPTLLVDAADGYCPVCPKSCSSLEIAEMTSVMPADLETALLITVPDMPKVIRDTRLRLDPGAALGVPEHVTVMYPFLDPDDVGEAIVDRLERICSETAGFEFSLTEVRWFGEAVVRLAPRPEDPFGGFQCWSRGNSAHGCTAVRTTRSRHT